MIRTTGSPGGPRSSSGPSRRRRAARPPPQPAGRPPTGAGRERWQPPPRPGPACATGSAGLPGFPPTPPLTSARLPRQLEVQSPPTSSPGQPARRGKASLPGLNLVHEALLNCLSVPTEDSRHHNTSWGRPRHRAVDWEGTMTAHRNTANNCVSEAGLVLGRRGCSARLAAPCLLLGSAGESPSIGGGP